MDLVLVGLILETVGVVIIWRFGWPQPDLEPGVTIVLEPNTTLADGRGHGPRG